MVGEVSADGKKSTHLINTGLRVILLPGQARNILLLFSSRAVGLSMSRVVEASRMLSLGPLPLLRVPL